MGEFDVDFKVHCLVF